MATSRAGWWGIGLLAIAAGAAAVWPRLDRDALEAELAARHAEQRELAQLRAERDKLLGVVPMPAELENLRADRAALVRLRQEIEAMKTRAATAAPVSSRTPAAPQKLEMRPLEGELRKVETFRDVGRSTPVAAGETFVWALQKGDIDLAASLLTFTPTARFRMEALLPELPAEIRTRYDTPERLMAYVMAGSTAVAELRYVSEGNLSPERAALGVEVRGPQGALRRDSVLFERSAEGWRRLVTDQSVAQLAFFLQDQAAAKK